MAEIGKSQGPKALCRICRIIGYADIGYAGVHCISNNEDEDFEISLEKTPEITSTFHKGILKEFDILKKMGFHKQIKTSFANQEVDWLQQLGEDELWESED